MENKHKYRIEIAYAIFLACNGNIDKAMKHEKMPYKRKNTIQRIAKEYKWYEKAGIRKPKKNGLTNEEIKRIYQVFLESNGHISKTAKLTGYARSTISKHSKANGWDKKLIQDGKAIINQSEEYTEKNIMEMLKKLRRKLLDEIINQKPPFATECLAKKSDSSPITGIQPKTLSEAVKALIDIDKRITERENQDSPSALDPYYAILKKCAEIIPEDES